MVPNQNRPTMSNNFSMKSIIEDNTSDQKTSQSQEIQKMLETLKSKETLTLLKNSKSPSQNPSLDKSLISDSSGMSPTSNLSNFTDIIKKTYNITTQCDCIPMSTLLCKRYISPNPELNVNRRN